MNNLPEGWVLAGAVALIALLLSQPGGAQLALDDPGANVIAASKENRRDPKRRLIPLHERPERPMLA